MSSQEEGQGRVVAKIDDGGKDSSVGLFQGVKSPPKPEPVGKAPEVPVEEPESKPEPVQAVSADEMPDISQINVTGLPSKGLPYPKDAKIGYRPFVLGEVSYLSESEISFTEQVEYVIKGMTCSFDPYDLTLSDFLFVGLHRKVTAVGIDVANLTFECPKCKQAVLAPIDIHNIEFEELEVPALPMNVKFSWGTHHFRPLTVKQYLHLVSLGVSEDKEKRSYAMMAAQMGCEGDSLLEWMDFLFNLKPGSDDAKILNIVDDRLYHGCKTKVITCQHCGHGSRVEVDGGDVFIVPFPRPGSPIEDAISFGKTSEHESS